MKVFKTLPNWNKNVNKLHSRGDLPQAHLSWKCFAGEKQRSLCTKKNLLPKFCICLEEADNSRGFISTTCINLNENFVQIPCSISRKFSWRYYKLKFFCCHSILLVTPTLSTFMTHGQLQICLIKGSKMLTIKPSDYSKDLFLKN